MPGSFFPTRMTPAKSSSLSCRSSSGASSSTATVVSAPSTSRPNTTAASSSTTATTQGQRVSRTHSFPKTSPLASLDFGSRLHRGFGSRLLGFGSSSSTHSPRPITNVTQAQLRTSQGGSLFSVSQSHIRESAVTVSASSQSAISHHEVAASGTNDLEKSRSLPPGATAPTSLSVSAMSDSKSKQHHSPRGLQRRASDKNDLNRPFSTIDPSSSTGASESKEHSRSSRPSRKSTSLRLDTDNNNSVSNGQMVALHSSMSTTAKVTPPNMAIGGSGVEGALHRESSPSQRSAEKASNVVHHQDMRTQKTCILCSIVSSTCSIAQSAVWWWMK